MTTKLLTTAAWSNFSAQMEVSRPRKASRSDPISPNHRTAQMCLGTTFTPGHYRRRVAGVLPVQPFVDALTVTFDPRTVGSGFAIGDLLIIGDASHHPFHVAHPDWVTPLDFGEPHLRGFENASIGEDRRTLVSLLDPFASPYDFLTPLCHVVPGVSVDPIRTRATVTVIAHPGLAGPGCPGPRPAGRSGRGSAGRRPPAGRPPCGRR